MKVWLPALRVGTGADVYTIRLAEELSRCGVDVSLQWFDARFELCPWLLAGRAQPAGTEVTLANSWNAFAFARRGVPLVAVEHHCVFEPDYRPHKSALAHLYHMALVKRFERASFRAAGAVVAVSRYTAGSLQRTLGLRGVGVIPNWVDAQRFCPAPSADAPGRPFRLLFVGNPSRRKGADLLAPIMQALGPGFELRVTGGLRDEAPRAGRRIVALGRLDDAALLREYQDCDALLFPSRFEGFGYAALEAMACGRPVVATEASALPEVVEHGVTGWLCPSGDVASFVAACRRLAADPAGRRAMGVAARQRVLQCFTAPVVVPRYIALFERLCRDEAAHARAGNGPAAGSGVGA